MPFDLVCTSIYVSDKCYGNALPKSAVHLHTLMKSTILKPLGKKIYNSTQLHYRSTAWTNLSSTTLIGRVNATFTEQSQQLGGSGNMSSSQIVALLVAVVDLALGGLISNGFIVTVTIRDWAKSKSLTSSEQLLLSLGISNLCAIVALCPYYFNAVSENIVSDKSKEKIFPFSIFIVISRFWFTAWLCVFYCVKIVNSTQSLFLWWKRKISWLIPRLLVGSLIIPFLIGCYASQNISVVLTIKSNTMANVTNGTQGNTVKYLIDSFKFSYYIIGSGFPLLVVFLCSILVVGSLYSHTCRIKGNKSSLKSFQTEAHMKAAGTVLCLLVLYISFVVAQSFATAAPLEKKASLLVSVVMMAYSPAQAAILVVVNPKLKQAATQML